MRTKEIIKTTRYNKIKKDHITQYIIKINNRIESILFESQEKSLKYYLENGYTFN